MTGVQGVSKGLERAGGEGVTVILPDFVRLIVFLGSRTRRYVSHDRHLIYLRTVFCMVSGFPRPRGSVAEIRRQEGRNECARPCPKPSPLLLKFSFPYSPISMMVKRVSGGMKERVLSLYSQGCLPKNLCRVFRISE